MRNKRVLTILVLAAAAMAAAAGLKKYKSWDRSPEAYFLTPAEKTEWARLTTDEEAEKFIAEYWKKRGGEPFHKFVEEGIAFADKSFRLGGKKGSETSRGKVILLMGPPSRREIESRGNAGASVPSLGVPSQRTAVPGQEEPVGPTGQSGEDHRETWYYEGDKVAPFWGVSAMTVRFDVDPAVGRDSILNASQVEPILEKAAEHSIVPAMPAQGKPAAGAAARAPQAPAGEQLSAGARQTLEQVLKEGGKPADAHIYTMTMWGSDGGPYLMAEIAFPQGSSAVAGVTDVQFVALVQDEKGEEAQQAVESGPLAASKTDRVFEHSFLLGPGRYRAAIALLKPVSGEAIASFKEEFELTARPEEFYVSPLVLTDDVSAAGTIKTLKDPFIFGGARVIPKADDLFGKTDPLGYFLLYWNPTMPAPAAAPAPGAAPAPAKPSIDIVITVFKDGRKYAANPQFSADCVKLPNGAWVTSSEFPPSTFPPGHYTMSIRSRDMKASRDSAAWKGVERKADFVVLNADGTEPAMPKTTPAPKKK